MNNNRTIIKMPHITEFGLEDDTSLINIYSDENPVLKQNENCYFIFNSLTDAHIPMIGYGRILVDKYISGMDKNYYIKLLKLHSPDNVINKHFYDKQFRIAGFGDNISKMILQKMNKDKLQKHPIFVIHSFFVRNTAEKITALHNDYKKIIYYDLQKQLRELELI